MKDTQLEEIDKILYEMLNEARPYDAKPFFYGEYKAKIQELITKARIDELEELHKKRFYAGDNSDIYYKIMAHIKLRLQKLNNRKGTQ